MNIGESIRILRKKKLMNQGVFANRVGITQPFLSSIETGRKTPSMGVLEKMANVLNTPLSILFWFGVDREDVYEDRRYIFDQLKPTIDKLIEEVFI